MNSGTSIQQAITLDPALPALVAEASRLQSGYVGFYFTYDGDDSQDGEWSYWTSETADATATNTYYTPAECRDLLVSRGYPELVG